jgi:hypothetical protein
MRISLQVSMSEAITALVEAGEQGVLAVQRAGGSSARQCWVDLDVAVVEEPAEPIPAVERITDRLGKLALAAGAGDAGLQQPAQAGDQRGAALLPFGAAFVGRMAADLLLDSIELRDVN